MSKVETVYDSTEIQLMAIERALEKKNLKLADLTTPEHVHLILEREKVHLTQLKENRAEITELRNAVTRLRRQREELRIDLAKSGQRERYSWIEIPLGMVSGFAINILTSDPKSTLGWFLLLISLLIITFLRISHLRDTSRKEQSDAKTEN